jgi:predicted lipoprotein with Yx(FWY)xxD motif
MNPILATMVVIAVVAAGCASAGASPVTSPSAETPTMAATVAAPTTAPTSGGGGRYGGGGSTPAPVTGSIVVKVATTGMGKVLVGPTGLTLYIKSGDSKNSSTCTGGCLQAWPPLTVPAGATATAGTGVTGTLGTFVRPDTGKTQVTYKGLPLYYYVGDSKPGDTTGDGVGGFKLATP